MMRKLFLVLAAVAPLAGCVSAEQMAQRAELEAKQDDAVCQRHGSVPGTPDYTQCMRRELEVRQQQAQDRAYARAQARAAFAAALANTGAMYQQRAAQAAAPTPVPAPQTCHTILDPNTNTATTHCY